MAYSKPAKPRQEIRSPDFFHFFIAFRNDVMRSFLRFIIGLREVLPHDTDAEQLNRADKDDHTHGGCPAGDRIAEAQASDNDDDQHDRCHECHPDPRPGCDAERHLREIDDAVKCILQQLPEVPLRLPCHTLYVLIWQPVRFKVDPAENALRKRLYSLIATIASTISRFMRRKSRLPEAWPRQLSSDLSPSLFNGDCEYMIVHKSATSAFRSIELQQSRKLIIALRYVYTLFISTTLSSKRYSRLYDVG